MSNFERPDHTRRREIYEFVEQNGAVTPETVRKNVLVQPESDSKPARSGGGLEASVSMSKAEFDHHVSILERDGYLTEEDGRLRIALPVDEEAEHVTVDGLEATVRAARHEDREGIVAVIETVADEHGYVVAARLAEQIHREDVLVRNNETEDRVFFVATVDGDVVGWLHVGAVKAPKMDHTATLTMGVLSRYRDGGLGSTLMERGLDWARSRGYKKVYQNLPATNEGAISFLEENGWTVESTREGHYHIDDELIDEAQLAIWLAE